MAFDKERAILVKSEADRAPVGPISDLVSGGLRLEEAHFICEQNIQARINAGQEVKGYKVGFTNIPVRNKMGLPDSTYGYLMDNMVLQSGGVFKMDELIAPKIECEICFKLSQRLAGPGLTIEQVLAHTQGVSASFEICDARIKDWKCPYPDFLADNGFAARIVLGEKGWVDPAQVDLLNEAVTLYKDGVQLATATGKEAMGHPANAVIWLADKLSHRKRYIRENYVVMTGTLTPILPIEPGTYRAEFSTLGAVETTFV